uniref:histidine-rich glycoprotein n=1 Tax=Euleptes europaea TaxID=460621 RepID=UPI0025402C7E|nr:histidine-rich glycoprotein [Euleptes europaea]
MELLPALVFCAVLLCSNAQSQPSVASADCNDTEKDARVALDLINKHRRDGYIFSLLRVVDAHVQHVENASIFYFTLDMVETECPVISWKQWETCGYGPFFGTSDFGRCNAVIYINRPSRKERLYGYNCTTSPVPPQLYECKRCPVKIIVLENIQQYMEEAERVLEHYYQESNQTKGFKVDKVTKVLLAVSDRTGYRVEFTIKETICPKTKLLSQLSGCEFLPDKYAHTGFCIGRVLNGTKDLDGVELESCEIYDIQYGRHPIHGHHQNDSREHHHRCNASRHGCRHLHHHHLHRCNASGHGSHHHHPHHHHHPPHHHHHHHCCPCGSAGNKGRSNSSKEIQEEDYPGFPSPPGPRYPPPPPGGPHHLPPSQFPPPPAGPPPLPGQPSWLPPLHRHAEGPDFHPPARLPCGPHRHEHRRNNAIHERGEDCSSKERDSFRSPQSFSEAEVGSVYRIPLASEDDVLQAPGADFPFPSHGGYEKPDAQPFPLTPSESESCPGKPIFDLPIDLLSLYPPTHIP